MYTQNAILLSYSLFLQCIIPSFKFCYLYHGYIFNMSNTSDKITRLCSTSMQPN